MHRPFNVNCFYHVTIFLKKYIEISTSISSFPSSGGVFVLFFYTNDKISVDDNLCMTVESTLTYKEGYNAEIDLSILRSLPIAISLLYIQLLYSALDITK